MRGVSPSTPLVFVCAVSRVWVLCWGGVRRVTVAELAKSLGRVGTYYPQGSNGLGFEVTVRDVRQVFGRLDFEVEPVAGRGRSWVGESSVKFPGEADRSMSDPF